MRPMFLWNLQDLKERWRWRSPAQQYSPPGGQAWKLAKKWTEPIRHQTFHQLLIAVVDESVEEKSIALRKDSL